MIPVQIGLLAIILGLVSRTNSIMVPTGKIGPITPFKPILPQVFSNRPYVPPAPVWERFDERDSIYQPPIYKYTAFDNAQKYNHRTLFPREEDYYGPPQATKTTHFYFTSKNKFYYSPLQFL